MSRIRPSTSGFQPRSVSGDPRYSRRGPFQILALVGDNGMDDCVVGDGGGEQVLSLGGQWEGGGTQTHTHSFCFWEKQKQLHYGVEFFFKKLE